MRTGLALMGLFTAFWSAWAVFSGSVMLALVGAIGVGLGLALVFRRLRLPPTAPNAVALPAVPRVLAMALAAETVAIAAVVLVLRSLDPDLIQPAIAVVVGLHFLIFYLSPTTRGRMHLLTTTASVLVGLAGLVAIAAHQPASVVHGLVGIGMAGVTLAYGTVFNRVLTRSSVTPGSG